MMILAELTNYKSPLKKALKKMHKLKKCQRIFLIETFGLFLGVLGKINFLQLSRFGKHCEQSYRNQFENRFDFMELNRLLIADNCSKNLTIAFDPSYINKSGKSTPHVGWFWSGVSGASKWGLEIGGIAVIDLDNHAAFHLEAVQTIKKPEESLLENYANTIVSRKESLLNISKYLVVDAYFSKGPFVSAICASGFEIVSRLRTDAHLQYAFIGKQKGGRGRPKKFAGKVDYNNLNLDHFDAVENQESEKIYKAKVYSKSLKKWIIVVLVYRKKKNKWSHKIYVSTDLNMTAKTVLAYYKARFQIEFLYRDAKQHTSLNYCQARSENKLHTHLNMSLTAVNLAKITHWLSQEKEKRKPFSMSDVKVGYSNDLHLKRFIRGFGIYPISKKNKTIINKLRIFGKIAA
jgi:hypothetical protein